MAFEQLMAESLKKKDKKEDRKEDKEDKKDKHNHSKDKAVASDPGKSHWGDES
jgi:hypothetical protein